MLLMKRTSICKQLAKKLILSYQLKKKENAVFTYSAITAVYFNPKEMFPTGSN